MKWRLVIRLRAESDLREAQDWYESHRAGLGADFVAEIEVALRILLRDPQRHAVYYRGFRRVFVRNSGCPERLRGSASSAGSIRFV